jgi:hypothetical protein
MAAAVGDFFDLFGGGRSIEEHPKRLHEDLDSLAIDALHEAWPCK